MKNIFNLRSYILFLSRNKLYTTITIFGFAVSLMFVILMAIYAKDEFTKDHFHENGDRIYHLTTGDGWDVVAAPIGEDLKGRYPEIENYTRLDSGDKLVETTNKTKYSVKSLSVDSSFFRMFDFPFLEGAASEVFNSASGVVLSEEFAHKLFGSKSAMGEEIKISTFGETTSYIVSGVIGNFRNTMFKKCDIILPIINSAYYSACNNSLMVLARQGADLKAKEAEMSEFLRGFFWIFKNDPNTKVEFIPLNDTYFNPARINGTEKGDERFLLILLSAAAMILIFAVINYINLSVAQSGFRAREMATRRLLGSPVAELFGKFIFESFTMCFIAFVMGLILAAVAMPIFNDVVQASISLSTVFTVSNILIALGFVILLGFISGIIPAYVITKFKPIEVVKGTFKYRTKKVYSKILIAFQYCITIVLIGSALTIVNQTSFMRDIEPGYEIENLFVVNHQVFTESQNALRGDLMAIPGVEQVAYCWGTPVTRSGNLSMTSDGIQHSWSVFAGDSAYLSVMGFEVLSRTGNLSDTAYWINETSFRALGLAPGTDQIRIENRNVNIALAGVVKDFHFKNLSEPISEALIAQRCDTHGATVLRLSSDGAIEQIRAVFDRYTDGAPFDGKYANEYWQEMSAAQSRQARLIGYLSIIAIVISSLGMLAMANYFIQQRSLEVAVRKIFGSTRTEALRMLIQGFLELVVIAFVIAVPLIWYFMDNWLMDFAYRISLGWLVFILAGLIALAVAFTTVFWQSYRAVSGNPVTTLKR